jgi:DNA polymerase-3 subunit epsilon
MFYNTKLLYTPPLEASELNERALVVDTETVGAGPSLEIVEIALGDCGGRILFESLVKPIFNPLPPPSKHHRFDRSEFAEAPVWTDIWPQVSALIDGRLLVAYNAAFDRRALAATCSRYRLHSTERGWRCAMQLVKQTIRTKKSLKLEDACGHFGVEGGNHRAGRDVEATCRLLQALLARRD